MPISKETRYHKQTGKIDNKPANVSYIYQVNVSMPHLKIKQRTVS